MLITLFSDASLCPETGSGGWAAWLKSDKGTVRGAGSFKRQTVDTAIAEAMAVVNALTLGARKGLVEPGDIVLVQTDNDAVMSVLLGRAKRKVTLRMRRRRKGSYAELKKEVARKNAEISEIAKTFDSYVSAYAVQVRWRHVKGHKGNSDPRSAVNTFCDKLAKRHMKQARQKKGPRVGATPVQLPLAA